MRGSLFEIDPDIVTGFCQSASPNLSWGWVGHAGGAAGLYSVVWGRVTTDLNTDTDRGFAGGRSFSAGSGSGESGSILTHFSSP